MALIDKDDLHKEIREEYDRQKSFYDLYHHVERGGIVQGLRYASMILCKQPEIPDIDRAAILRLLDEADDIVNALYKQGANKDYKCKSLREKLKEIGKELTGDAGTD